MVDLIRFAPLEEFKIDHHFIYQDSKLLFLNHFQTFFLLMNSYQDLKGKTVICIDDDDVPQQELVRDISRRNARHHLSPRAPHTAACSSRNSESDGHQKRKASDMDDCVIVGTLPSQRPAPAAVHVRMESTSPRRLRSRRNELDRFARPLRQVIFIVSFYWFLFFSEILKPNHKFVVAID